ncbi:MAG: type 1 glutamine amidotransferase [Jatrophihabitans sp.]
MDPARVVVLQLDPADPPGRLADWLTAGGVDVGVCDLTCGAQVPDDLSAYGGIVVLGGPMSAHDDAQYPFLADVRNLLRAAVRDEIPTLAICLGAQLLAVATGGRVEPNPEGPELGAQLIAKRAAAATDPLFGPMPITPDVIQWHYDTVSVLPPAAVHLATSPSCANQAFRIGRLAWGIQFHIESNQPVVEGWARADVQRLNGFDLELIVSRAAAVQADVEEVWAPFVNAFAAVVRDPGAVPAPRGVRTSTAAPVTDPAAIRAALAAEAGASRTSSQGLGLPTLRPPTAGRSPGD